MAKNMIRLQSKCLVCKSRLEKILDLGVHPYADTFIKKSQLKLKEPRFPLECYLCKQCGNIQLGYITHDFDRYNLYSYSYTSSNSNFSRNHWDEYAKTMRKRFNLKNKKVVEIGSNDGYLIGQFKKDNKILGIDPSYEIAKLAKKAGVPIKIDLFNSKTGEAVRKKFGTADLIIANNVFNHSNDPLDFAKGVSNLLSEEGVFVFELPYWLDTVLSKKFDQIYHEHVTYFTVKFASNLLTLAGMEIFDADKVDYHGGSIRIYARKGKHDLPDKVKKMLINENKLKLFEINTYKKLQKDIENIKNKLLSKIKKIKKGGGSIVAVGAAAKGNTFLNFYGLDHYVIDYVTDSSPSKIGKFTPLTRIPIVSDEIFRKYGKVYALILSWNLSETLKKNLLKINGKIRFI